MLLKTDVANTKRQIKNNIGTKVKLEFSKGRQKSIVGNGVITDAYPCIFTVQLFEGQEPSRKISFSYIDILTNSVEIILCK